MFHVRSLVLAECFQKTVAMDGMLYVIGGYTADSNRRVSRYDPSTNTWLRLANTNQGHENHGAAAGGGYLWTYGGWNSDFERYDPSTDTWTTLASPSVSLGTGGNNLVWLDPYLYVFGGYSTSNTYRYDPVAGTWTTLANSGYSRYNGYPVAGMNIV